MVRCRSLCYLGIVMMMWGFIWGIFLRDFLWMSVAGMILGWTFSKED